MEFVIELVGLCAVGVLVLLDAHRLDLQRLTRRASARPSSDAKRCPYCHEDLAAEPELPRIHCARCRAPHHAACWEDDPRCAVYGCGSEATVDEAESLADPAREVAAASE